jgi:hypothetical protein
MCIDGPAAVELLENSLAVLTVLNDGFEHVLTVKISELAVIGRWGFHEQLGEELVIGHGGWFSICE